MVGLPDVDVAIVGGGIGGIYAGWRLLGSALGDQRAASWARQRGALKVALFEGSGRIGGRLLSARSPLMPDTTAELGGMRYVSPAQTLIQHLVEDVLGLPTHEQTVDVADNIAFLRGQLLRTRDLSTPAALPYRFDRAEANWLAANKGQNPAALIERVLTRLMPDIEAQRAQNKLRQYLAEIIIDGLPLWRHGLWNLLARDMSTDAYEAARATVGYDCLGGNTNALDLTQAYFDFTPGIHYKMVDGGYETVPWKLQQRFVAAGGSVHFGHWLDGFTGISLADGSPGVRLDFHPGPGVTASTVTARAIVLAMPRRSIELLRPEGEVLGRDNARFREDLASVSAIPLAKLFLLYPQSWWQAAGVSAGRSLTDLPLRQAYYWPTGPGGETVPKPADPGVIMAYDDLQSVSFWGGLDTRRETRRAGLALGRAYSGQYQWPLFGNTASSPAPVGDDFARQLMENWSDHQATKPMVRELHRQLMQMHGVDTAPEPIDAAFMDWSRDPYGGGVHLWNVNYQSDRLLVSMTQPVADFPCYICGEAYSTNQTWAEGALQTAEIVVNRLLDRPPMAPAG